MRPAKLEEIAFGEIQLLSQGLPQHALGAEVPASDRFLRNTQASGSFNHGELLYRAQHENDAKILRQLIDLPFEQIAHLRTPERFFR